MSHTPIYLDHAATSPLRPEAGRAWLEIGQMGLNASSIHSLGRKGKAILEASREAILDHVGAQGETLIFTSGGTESNGLAMSQAQYGFERIIVSATEHDSVMVTAMKSGLSLDILPVKNDGTADLDMLEAMLRQGGRAFVCLMWVNNETGVINDVARAASLVANAGGWLHIDGVQALGKLDIDFEIIGADSLAVSAHKIGGPQGVGALIVRTSHHIWPVISGGGQEKGARAGTENLAGIAAFAAALTAQKSHQEFKSPVEQALKALGCTILGDGAKRVSEILCFAQPEWSSQLQLMHLDMNGICVSSGSACSSGKVKESRVAAAMGYEALAGNVLRVSSGWTTTEADWLTFLDVWSQGYAQFLARRETNATRKVG